MIITLTLNPAIDQTIEVDHLHIGALNKVVDVTRDAGGKGINVSKVIQSLGGKSIAMGILAGKAGDFIREALGQFGIQSDFHWVHGETRTNMKIFDPQTKVTTEINEAGPLVEPYMVAEMLDNIKANMKLPCLVVISGSIPKTLPRDTYKGLVEALKAEGASVFLDADGELFENGIKGKPDYIKPNRDELEKYFAKAIDSDQALIEAGRHFIEMGVGQVLISLGGEGAMYVSKTEAIKMHPLKIDAHSSVGAGDAFVGGFSYGIESGLSLEETLKLAVATSAGAVMTVGTKPMEKSWVDAHITQVKLEKM